MAHNPNDRSEKPVFGFCNWCYEPLDSGEFFVYEMERSAWEEGTEGLPEHKAVFLVNGEPVPSCKRCRESMIKQYEGNYESSKFDNFLNYSAIVLFIALCIMVAAKLAFDIYELS